MANLIERHELQTGEIAIIQRYRRRYSLFIVSPILGVAPEYMIESGTLAECRDLLADLLESDICDTCC